MRVFILCSGEGKLALQGVLAAREVVAGWLDSDRETVAGVQLQPDQSEGVENPGCGNRLGIRRINESSRLLVIPQPGGGSRRGG